MNELLPTDIVTHDVDINIALPQKQALRVLDSLATLFPISEREKAERELRTFAQTRLRWGDLPVDLFLANTPFHEAMAGRPGDVDFAGTSIPVSSPEDERIRRIKGFIAQYQRGEGPERR